MFEKKKDEVKEQEAASNGREGAAAGAPASRNRGSGSPAVIGATIRVKGEVSGEEDLVVEGTVEGTISLEKHDLTVGPSAHVLADVTAKVVRIEGEVIGDVRGIERVTISQAGRMQGNLSAPRVVVEDGAKFRGTIEMDGFDGASGMGSPRDA